MTQHELPIADEAKDGLSVAPPDPAGDDDAQDAVDIGSEDSMDASDPPSTSAPGSQRDVDQAKEIDR
ncbi:hypothetical protein [Sphingomonas sp.]|uniref:hypothetical protein n=1 Tax=Sphingomonas sp. TaxID=28214 RepID=UPI002CEC853C|nr:hypothetical protein [Sphingomonas sp.]HTG37940.1 hypothetical protein [Sphingomonas sp.]